MNYKTKNARNALITLILLTTGFYFFFMKLWLALIISVFLTITMFFTPSKIEKAKKKAEQQEAAITKDVNPKEISDDDLNNLDLNNVEGFNIDENKKDAN
ncbi:hypothetical protein ACQPU1_05685 [Clostridium paraputrificum]|uniref:hypothetical protein n=1 Tax=Clostridium TaxID=1485 RepID=UPI003D3301C1